MKNITQLLKLIALALVLSIGISYVSAWTTPTVMPPNGNVAAPINVGGTTQTKTGDLGLGRNLTSANSFGFFAKNSAGTDEQWMWPRYSDNVMYTNFGANGWNIRNNTSNNVMFMGNNGNVGIGTVAPNAKLEVAGELKIGNSGVLCSAAQEGSLRYNGLIKCTEICNGTAWSSMCNTVPAGDTIAPTIPTSLAATAVSTSQINLTWNTSSDNVGVTDYGVYRFGVLVANVTGTSYADTGLASATTYTYYVVARDAAGNSSGNSNLASATTWTPPPPPPPDSYGSWGQTLCQAAPSDTCNGGTFAEYLCPNGVSQSCQDVKFRNGCDGPGVWNYRSVVCNP